MASISSDSSANQSCGFDIIPCRYASLGCTAVGPSGELHQHLAEDIIHHLAILEHAHDEEVKRGVALEKETKELRRLVEDLEQRSAKELEHADSPSGSFSRKRKHFEISEVEIPPPTILTSLQFQQHVSETIFLLKKHNYVLDRLPQYSKIVRAAMTCSFTPQYEPILPSMTGLPPFERHLSDCRVGSLVLLRITDPHGRNDHSMSLELVGEGKEKPLFDASDRSYLYFFATKWISKKTIRFQFLAGEVFVAIITDVLDAKKNHFGALPVCLLVPTEP